MESNPHHTSIIWRVCGSDFDSNRGSRVEHVLHVKIPGSVASAHLGQAGTRDRVVLSLPVAAGYAVFPIEVDGIVHGASGLVFIAGKRTPHA